MNHSSANILFTSVGRRVSLIRHFIASFNKLNIGGGVFLADSGRTAPALFLSKYTFRTPIVSDPQYVQEILQICLSRKIDLLISLIDTDLHILSRYSSEFESIGTRLLISSEETNQICFDKNASNEFFLKHNINTPYVYENSALSNIPQKEYPLLVKPWDGSCSVGVTRVNSVKELLFFVDYVNHAMVQEYVQGDEYTCDVYVDFMGKIRCVVPRRRIETRAGEVSKGITVRDEDIIDAVSVVVEKLPGAIGCITIQCFKKENGEICFIEINPRFGGGIPLSIQAGADFPTWILQELCGLSCEANNDQWKADTVMLRYDDEIIVRGDDII